MVFGKNTFFFLLVLAVLAVSWQASSNWNAFPYEDYVLSTSLESFDKKIVEGNGACFDLQIHSNDSARENFVRFRATVNDKIAVDKEISVLSTPLISECLAGELFDREDNFVELSVYKQRVFFHAQKVPQLSQSTPELAIEDAGRGMVRVSVSGYNGARFEPLTLSVNGGKDHSLYFEGENFESVEKIGLAEGTNKVSVEFAGQKEEITVGKKTGFAANPFFGLALIALLLSAIFLLVFTQEPLAERAMLSIIGFFAMIFLPALALDFAGLLSAFSFNAIIAIETLAVIILFRKNLGKGFDALLEVKKFLEKPSFLLAGLLLFFLFSSLFYHFFTNTYVSPFTSFYERQSDRITQLEHVPQNDDLGFFGEKPAGFFSAYFFLNAGISWLTGFDTRSSFAIILFLAQLAFICASIVFFRAFGASEKNSYLGALAVLLGVFVFSDFLYNVRHVVADSMLLAAAVFLRRGKTLESGVLAGFASFVQAPMILMFAAISLVGLDSRKRFFDLAKALAVAGILAVVFFAPTVMRAGFPSQAKSTVWGYLWNIPLYGFFLDYFSIFALIALFVAPFVLTGKVKAGSFEKRLTAIILVFFAVQLFVSYRINVVNSFLLALLAARLFPEKIFDNPFAEYALGAIIVGALLSLTIVSMAFYPMHPTAIDAFAYVRENTSTNQRFLVEPYLGHSFTFFAQRKASADLAVEYADEELIDDSYRFLKESDYTVLEKMNADYVFNRSIYLDEKPVGDNLFRRTMEFEKLDKVYSNDIFFVHYKGN
ncbi:MAG: hypothetical protein HY392_01235 [Candidatus Diapherotrites archaeon]|nr:hypothetical protein [Candidatus Diapherotrites archaeon]